MRFFSDPPYCDISLILGGASDRCDFNFIGYTLIVYHIFDEVNIAHFALEHHRVENQISVLV